MKFTQALLVLAVLAAHVQIVQAQEDPFAASVSLGYVGTTGNTDTTTFNSEALLTLRSEDWTHNGKFQALGSQENSTTKAERYYLEDKSDYNLDADQYLYLKGSYLDDRFSGYGYQATGTAGYGRYLLRSDNLTLQGFGGAGYRQNDIINGPSDGEGIVTVGEKLDWVISSNAKLVQSFTSDIGEQLSISFFELGLETNIVGQITTKIAFQARNISEVPVGKKKTDTQTSVSLVYSF